MATIGKTFSDPDKYEQNWFTDLSTKQKFLYMYCWDRCDHAGVLEISLKTWSFHTNIDLELNDLDELIDKCNEGKERIVKLETQIWFTEYIRFNQVTDPTKGMSCNHPFHKHVYGRLMLHGLFERLYDRDMLLLKDFKSVYEKDSNPSVSLSEALHKPTGKSEDAGRGGGNGEGLGSGNGSSPYYQSKSIAERLSRESYSSHQLTTEVSEILKELKDKKGIVDPYNHIDYVLSEMEQYYSKDELTIHALKEKLGLSSNQ